MKFILEGFTSTCQEFKESLIVFFCCFCFQFGPKRLNDIDGFSIDGDGEVNKIRILLNDLLYICFLYELLMFLFDMHNNFCSSGEGIILYSFDIKCS